MIAGKLRYTFHGLSIREKIPRDNYIVIALILEPDR